MKDLDLNDPKRRRLMQASLVMGGLGALLSVRAAAAQRSAISMQLGWVPGGGQVGEVVAKRLGFYEREGIDLKIEPGAQYRWRGHRGLRPWADRTGLVQPIGHAGGVRGLPIKCFAVGVQRHPYAFFSLGKNPIRKPQDMIGKRIGIHATGMVLLKAMLARHQIPENQVSIVPIGSDMMPCSAAAWTPWPAGRPTSRRSRRWAPSASI